jgi:nucleoside-diphosphate-sugar epimerase
VHAKDFAKGIQLSAEKAKTSVPINVGHDEETSIRQLLETILELADAQDRDIYYNTDMPEGYPRRAADTTRLKDVTDGFVPSISLEEGLTEMIEWYRRHGDTAGN